MICNTVILIALQEQPYITIKAVSQPSSHLRILQSSFPLCLSIFDEAKA
jgi:hypothetical protein